MSDDFNFTETLTDIKHKNNIRNHSIIIGFKACVVLFLQCFHEKDTVKQENTLKTLVWSDIYRVINTLRERESGQIIVC